VKTEIAKFEGIPLFAEFNRQELEAFVELTDPLNYKRDSVIVRQDEIGDCMFIVIDGKTRVVHRRDGREFLLAVLERGDFFGELALVDEGPRSADVIALEDCTMLRIPHPVMRALASVHPMAAFKFIQAVARGMVHRMRDANRRYIDTLMVKSN